MVLHIKKNCSKILDIFHNIFKKSYLRSMKILYIDKWKMKSDVIFFNKNLIFLILYYTSAV